MAKKKHWLEDLDDQFQAVKNTSTSDSVKNILQTLMDGIAVQEGVIVSLKSRIDELEAAAAKPATAKKRSAKK